MIERANVLSARSSDLVQAADEIIVQYQTDSRDRLNMVTVQLIVIATVYLGALVFGTMLAVVPMRRRILSQMRDLGEYAEDLEDQKRELEEVREVIMSILQDNQLGKLAAETAEKKTAEYAHQLEYSNTELQDFAHVASHDLKEPLRKILVFGDMLKTEVQDGLAPQQKDYVDRMQDAAKRMQNLIEGLLDYSSVTQAAPQLEWVDLNEVLSEVSSDLEMKIKETRAVIDYGDLPEVLADKLRMQQLFQNLISNAIKYQAPGNVPRVTIRHRRAEDGAVEISVADNGIGFDPKQSDRIFKPFERLHSRSAYEGSGIGLAICRKIVMSHRGKLEVESEPGRGSVFYVRLRSKNPTE